MTTDADRVTQGAAAWRDIRRGASFASWLVVAAALQVGREVCMRQAETNRPLGARYNALMGRWLEANGFHGLTGQERYAALQVVERIADIERWRATLSEDQRRRWNSPGCVMTQFKRHQRATAGTPTQRAAAQLTKLGLDQAQIARASDAIYALMKVGNTDCYVLARAALLAACRVPNLRRERERAREAGEDARMVAT